MFALVWARVFVLKKKVEKCQAVLAANFLRINFYTRCKSRAAAGASIFHQPINSLSAALTDSSSHSASVVAWLARYSSCSFRRAAQISPLKILVELADSLGRAITPTNEVRNV